MSRKQPTPPPPTPVRHKFNLGDRVRCIISGYKGIVISRNEWLNGCKQYCVKSDVLKDGLPQDGQWIDGEQLELVKSKAIEVPYENTGGPALERMPRSSGNE